MMKKAAFHMILIEFCAAAHGIVKQGEIGHGWNRQDMNGRIIRVLMAGVWAT